MDIKELPMTYTVANQVILNHNTPRDSAQKFLDAFRIEGLRSLIRVPNSGEFWIWENGHHHIIDEAELLSQIASFLNFAKCLRIQDGVESLVPFITNRNRELEVLHALKNICSQGKFKDPRVDPSWIFSDHVENLPNPGMGIKFLNKTLFIDEYLKTGNISSSLRDNQPSYFTAYQLPLCLEPTLPAPSKWIAFLENILENNEESIQLIQEWFGYCLTSMTQYQKILLIVGPTRAGKGIITKTLQTILGEGNYATPSASSLSDAFGIECLINKRLAILSDARFAKEKDKAKEVLLSVSGEDDLLINRKYKPAYNIKLPTKFMICSNEIPSFSDAGAALASRFLLIQLHKSFLGKEDIHLFERDIAPEASQIILWALEGLRSLLERKKFIQPSSYASTLEFLRHQQSPILLFLQERCTIDSGLSIPKNTLYNAYKAWCEEEGIEPLVLVHFSRYIFSASSHIRPQRKRNDGQLKQYYDGISLADRV